MTARIACLLTFVAFATATLLVPIARTSDSPGAVPERRSNATVSSALAAESVVVHHGR